MRPKCRNPFYERKEEKGRTERRRKGGPKGGERADRKEEKGRNRKEEKGRKGRKMRGGKKKNGPECNEDPLSAKCRGPKNV